MVKWTGREIWVTGQKVQFWVFVKETVAHPLSRTPYAYGEPDPTENLVPLSRPPSLST